MRRLRTIIESRRYEDDKYNLELDDRLLDEVMFGVTWTLARDPEVGQPTDVEDIRVISTHSTNSLPPLSVYYTWNEVTVILLSLVRAAEDDK